MVLRKTKTPAGAGRLLRRLAAALTLLAAAPAGALVTAGPAGAADPFDYYLLSLSWSPSWCAAEGEGATSADQCDPGRDLGFILHGLWPQFEDGWPEHCDGSTRDPSRRETAAMADVMGSGGLAWYQWRKHGRCSGLDPEDYFAQARQAFRSLSLPRPAETTDARSVTAAFRAANPGIAPEGILATCRGGLLREVRICLTRDLDPRPCGADVLEDACRPSRALEAPEAP